MGTNKRDCISRLERAAVARKLRDQGLLYREIAERLGISVTYVGALLTDPDGSKDSIRKKEKYFGICMDCGGRTSYGHARRGQKVSLRCLACSKAHERMTRMKWTKERIIAEMKRWNLIYGRPPLAEEWLRLPPRGKRGREWPHVACVQREFGSWSNGIEAAGFERRINYERTPEWKASVTKWPKEKIIEAFQNWNAEHGRPPTSTEWRYGGGDEHPSYSVVSRRFGSWNKGIRAAGFTPLRRGSLPGRPIRAIPSVNGGPIVPPFESRGEGRSLIDVVQDLKGESNG